MAALMSRIIPTVYLPGSHIQNYLPLQNALLRVNKWNVRILFTVKIPPWNCLQSLAVTIILAQHLFLTLQHPLMQFCFPASGGVCLLSFCWFGSFYTRLPLKQTKSAFYGKIVLEQKDFTPTLTTPGCGRSPC